MQLSIITAPPFRYRAFSRERKLFCKALFLIFSKAKTSPNGNRKIFHLVERASLRRKEIRSK